LTQIVTEALDVTFWGGIGLAAIIQL
jgi:hypothetical protein